MKKYIFGAVFSLALLASPTFTQAAALTSAQISAIVALLQSFGADQATINNVEISLNGGTPTGGGTQQWCYNFGTDLTIGSGGVDVAALRQALGSSGITPTISNTFDEDTANYVVRFQAKYGIRQTGYVGPITRAKLNSLYGCSTTTGPSITVISPNGGETWIRGNTYNINWRASNLEKVRIDLIDYSCSSELFLRIADGISASQNSYSWIIPNNLFENSSTYCPSYGINNPTTHYGWKSGDNFKVIISELRTDGTHGAQDESDAPFSIVAAGTTTYTPNITGTGAPAAANFEMDAGGSVSIYGTYLAGNTISTTKVFIGGIQAAVLSASDSVLTATVPSFLTLGSYDMYVSNEKGVSNVVRVKILSNLTSTPITLTAILPSSGPVGTSIRLDGCGSDSSSGFTLVYSGPKSGTALIPIETLGAASGCGYMTITVPSDFPAGSYSLSVKNNQTGAMSMNSMAFTVTAPVVANNPVASVSPTSFVAGANFTSSIAGAAPKATIHVFSTGPDGVTSEDLPAGTTDTSGQFSRAHVTTGWAAGSYRGWVTVNGVQSNVVTFTVTTSGGGSVSSAKCTTSFSPKSIKAGDVTTWNFQAGAGDTTFQYWCTGGGITKEDGTTLLSYGQLPLSGPWRIKITAPMDCTLDSYNPNVTGSGSQCRDIISPTFFIITTASLPNASANISYSTTLATTDVGTAPYQWSWSPAVSGSGVLPAGLTINPSTGVISGTPTTAGKYDVAIKVTNAAGNIATKNFTLYVDAQAGVSTKCTTSISKTGDSYTWNFQAGAGDTTFQYSCSSGFTKADGTAALGYGTLPMSGSWNITVPGYGYIDCTLDSYNPNVTGSGSQCRANSFGFVLGNSTSQAPATTFTYIWNRDLQIGSPYLDDVTALQKALTLNGEYTGEITGGFYNQTYTAVKAFQKKYGINATGYVGSLTRTQLNTLFAR